MARSILIVDDETSILKSLEGILSDEGFDVFCAESGINALEKMEEVIPDLVLLDIWMSGMDGIETLVKIKELYSSVQVVMMSGHGNIETAVKATKLGAYDFIEKPLSLEKLLLSVKNALEYFRLEEEVRLLREKEGRKYSITGCSDSVMSLKEEILKVAPTDAWVLILGENGTGKELVAHTIHSLSRRSNKPMVEVNCAAIPDDLIESELFGHEKGAFTGASTMRKGKFDLAHEGTIFLDEIGDMSLKAQSKTLRILQEQKFERVGGSRTIEVNVRVLTATNKNLQVEMEKGNFREDLYYRLNVIPLKVAPLRKRIVDIPDLTNEFIEEFSLGMNIQAKTISKKALSLLKAYDWPGNVRELKNLVERLVIMSKGSIIEDSDIPHPYNGLTGDRRTLTDEFMNSNFKEAKSKFEKTFLEKKLKEFDGNISQTAEAIGIERSNLHKKIKMYGFKDIKSNQ
ncbi:sigma-54-dependent transcriptional regulator [Thermodesulfobacteriota bacterium]